VLLHGIHNLGIEDPRLISLARALAGAGVAVMTPQLQDLTEYRVTPETVDLIGNSAAIFADRMGVSKVGVVGMSVAGGLSLLAAARHQYEDKIGFVLAVGAHDDLARVARFFVENSIEAPDGSTVGFQAHEYGVADLSPAHDALRQVLWERPSLVNAADKLSPAGRTTLDQLLHHREALHEALLSEIKSHAAEMDAVSPHGKLSQLSVPVYLLHGSGDTLIPPSETQWLAKEVPNQELKTVLISSALIHVDMDKTVPWSQQWALISFMAQVLEAADRLPSATAVSQGGGETKADLEGSL
jgi:pimeloyl-ACP methyl ester carboxylesterase